MNHPNPPQISVTVRDAARLTGLSETYLSDSVAEGTLPAHRVAVGTGARPRIVIPYAELEAFVRSHPVVGESA